LLLEHAFCCCSLSCVRRCCLLLLFAAAVLSVSSLSHLRSAPGQARQSRARGPRTACKRTAQRSWTQGGGTHWCSPPLRRGALSVASSAARCCSTSRQIPLAASAQTSRVQSSATADVQSMPRRGNPRSNAGESALSRPLVALRCPQATSCLTQTSGRRGRQPSCARVQPTANATRRRARRAQQNNEHGRIGNTTQRCVLACALPSLLWTSLAEPLALTPARGSRSRASRRHLHDAGRGCSAQHPPRLICISAAHNPSPHLCWRTNVAISPVRLGRPPEWLGVLGALLLFRTAHSRVASAAVLTSQWRRTTVQ
jgi:hypothetical protein